MDLSWGKIYAKTWTGSLIGAGAPVFAVLSYSIASARPPEGLVELNPELLAFLIGETQEQISKAISFLAAPDVRSRSKSLDGRRIVHLNGFTYRLINFIQHRDGFIDSETKEYWRTKKKVQRSKSVPGCPSENVRDCPQAEAEAEAEAEASTRSFVERETSSPELTAVDATRQSQSPSHFCEIPSLDEVKTEAQMIGLAEWVAVLWWKEMEGIGWKLKGQSVAKWRKLLDVKRTWWEADGRPMQPKGRHAANQPNPRPGADRSANTLNAGKSGQYAGIGKVGGV